MSDAAVLLVRRMGGADAVAHRLKKSAHSFRHELTGSGTAKLGHHTVRDITALAHLDRTPDALAILNEWVSEYGMLIPHHDEYAADDRTFEDMARAAREFGEFVASVAKAAADGEVSANELKDVDREMGEMIASAQTLRKRLAAMHEEHKARHGGGAV